MIIKHCLSISLVLFSSLPLKADDGAAVIAAGGIVVMDREPRVTMAKEVLEISAKKVTVDYDFRNDSDEDVTTEVSFPIPDYDLSRGEANPARRGFDDFRLWVNGKPASYQVQARAYLKGKDYTQLLTSMHVDVASFGHATSNVDAADIQRLTPAQHQELVQAGLIDASYGVLSWTVKKEYYWKQTFPAHTTVHIRHEYSPALGATDSIRYALGPQPDPAGVDELESFCIDGRLRAKLSRIAVSKTKDAPYFYVDFILTTANTWKRPIEDFTLIVDRPHESKYVSFCWDGPIRKINADHFSTHATNFVPKKELRVGFFDVMDTGP